MKWSMRKVLRHRVSLLTRSIILTSAIMLIALVIFIIFISLVSPQIDLTLSLAPLFAVAMLRTGYVFPLAAAGVLKAAAPDWPVELAAAKGSNVSDSNFALSLGLGFMGQAEKVVGPDKQHPAIGGHYVKAPRLEQFAVSELRHLFIVA